MIKVKSIYIERAEGMAEECYGVTVYSINAANNILRLWSETVREGGYDKCDFKIVFEDGNTYDGRYDLENMKKGLPDLAGHVKSFVNFLAGIAPEWMKKDKSILARYQADIAANPERAEEAKKWLTTYDLG